MSIYFIRHGQSEFNAVFEPLGPDPLIFDAPLSLLGRQQAIQAREQVSTLGIKRVIVSPMTRALETALHIFGEDQPLEIDARVRERLSNSCDVGRSPAALIKDFPQLSFDHIAPIWWHQGEANEHGVAHEPIYVFEQRAAEFRNWLLRLPDQPTAIVGHGMLFKALIGRKLDNCEVHAFTKIKQEIYSI